MSGSTPYVSVAFVNRNDGYGGDLQQRIAKFIEYYAYYAALWPGLLEFVICDWNPPDDYPRLRDSFAWEKLGNVLHVEVPREVHQSIAGPKSRKMLDYIGRNVALRRGRGEYSLVLNQDIFIGCSILQLIAARKLDHHYFYRADRCDFHFEPCRNVPPQDFEAAALAETFAVHRRHDPGGRSISALATTETLTVEGTITQPADRVDPATGVLYADGATQRRRSRRRGRLGWRGLFWTRAAREAWYRELRDTYYHRSYYLHTNASGDFILAARKAFETIHGLNESTSFYLHLDSYAIIQLFAAGYEPAIFIQPHRVFHADHDRSGRADFEEPMTWVEHEAEFSAILRGDRSFQINGADWGLRRFGLPQWRVGSGDG